MGNYRGVLYGTCRMKRPGLGFTQEPVAMGGHSQVGPWEKSSVRLACGSEAPRSELWVPAMVGGRCAGANVTFPECVGKTRL